MLSKNLIIWKFLNLTKNWRDSLINTYRFKLNILGKNNSKIIFLTF